MQGTGAPPWCRPARYRRGCGPAGCGLARRQHAVEAACSRAGILSLGAKRVSASQHGAEPAACRGAEQQSISNPLALLRYIQHESMKCGSSTQHGEQCTRPQGVDRAGHQQSERWAGPGLAWGGRGAGRERWIQRRRRGRRRPTRAEALQQRPSSTAQTRCRPLLNRPPPLQRELGYLPY